MTIKPLITTLAAGLLAGTCALTYAANVATKATDEQITEQVKNKLAADDPVVAPRIQVATKDGIVTLEGVVLTNDYVLKALRAADSVDGVVKVKNRLTPQ